MKLCDQCDRIVTADTVCALASCPHQDMIVRPVAVVAASAKASRKKAASASVDPIGVETVTFDEGAAEALSSPDGALCPACGTRNMRGAKFCAGCGTTLATATSVAPAASTAEYYEPVRQDTQMRTIAFAVAALIIIGLLGYLAFGKGDPATENVPVVANNDAAKEAAVKLIGQETTMWVVADANIRKRATAKGSQLLGKIPRGTQLTGIMQMGEDGRSPWFNLVDGRGFVGAVNLSQTEPPRLAKMLSDQTWYAPDAVAVLALPDSNSPQIATLTPGQLVKLSGITENGFAEAKLNKGGVGYIASGSYDFSVSTPVLTSNEQGDLPDFFASMGLDSSAGPYQYSGVASDQNIRLMIWQPTPRGSTASMEYRNTRTGNTCRSSLNLIGRDAKGRFLFAQAPEAEGNRCGMFPQVTLSANGGLFDAWWKQGDQTLMSAKLRMN